MSDFQYATLCARSVIRKTGSQSSTVEFRHIYTKEQIEKYIDETDNEQIVVLELTVHKYMIFVSPER